MESVVEKLADIEMTAEAIVEHAEAQKKEIEKEIQRKRDQFDENLESETQVQLDQIKAEADREM